MQESRQPTFNILKAAHNILGYGTRLFAYLRGQKSEKKTQTHGWKKRLAYVSLLSNPDLGTTTSHPTL